MSLIRAVQNDGINTVQELLGKEVDVNYVDSEGKSALYYAIKKKNSSIVELLLKRKADIYLEVSNNNDILADRASRIYESEGKILDTNEKDISQLIEEKILEDSVRVLKECEEPEQSDPKDENTEASLVKAKAEVREKIDELLKRLADRDSSDYKDANTFIRFLETFAFDDDLTRKYDKDLKREFLNDDHIAYISVKKFRGVLLKSSGKIRNPENIFNGIRFCFILENKDSDVDKKKEFFDELEKYLKRFKIENSAEPVKNNIGIISNFFKCQNEKQIKEIVNEGQTDDAINKIIYKKFVNLILKAYKNEIDEEEQWFEFNVNIFPCLGITRNDEKNEIGQMEEIKKRRLLENQMLRLRNNFVHSFVQHKPEAFKDFITKLKGKLFEYYYARKLHESLITAITWDVKEIEDEINKDFESIQNEFTHDNKLYWSEEKSANQSIQKYEDMLLPMLLSDDEFYQPLVEDYFIFMPIIEYMNKNERDKCYSKCRNNLEDIQESKQSSRIHVNQYLKLDDWSRRQFFERFKNIKDYKEKNDEEKYTQEKESLISDLRRYGINRKCVEKIFRCYLEEGNKLSDAVSTVVKKIVKFIVCLMDVKRNFIKNTTLIDIVESILRDPADLVLRVDLPQIPEDIPEHPIIQKLVKTFTSVKINDIEVDVKATIKTMVKTFCYRFYLFKAEQEFNARDLFSREAFLNALLNEEEKLLQDYSEKRGADKVRLFTLINQLITIDYMSPFIAKLVKHLDTKDSCFIQRLINKDMMKRLIKNLANKDFLDYLSILLSVKFVTYNPYLLLYDYITENIKNLDEDENGKPLIFSIFNNFDHIKGFADVLISMENKHCFDYVEEIIIPFLETINKKVAGEFHYASYYDGSNVKVLLNKKLNDDLTGVTAPDPTAENQVEILNKNEEKYEEQYNVMTEILLKNEEIEYGFSNQIAPCHVHFIERDILRVQINSARLRFYPFTDLQLLSSTIYKLDTCQDIKHSEIHGRYKLLIFGLFPNISEWIIGLDYQHLYCNILKHVKGKDCQDTRIENIRETYEEIKDNDTYKELLSTSDLLESSVYLDVFHVASWMAFYNLMNTQNCRSKYRDESKLLRILNVYKSIYSHLKKDTKNIKTIEHLKYIANVYKELGIVCGAKNKYGKASSYCLKSLARYNTYYEIRKDMHIYFVENAIKNKMLYTLIVYIFARYNFSKTLKNKKNLDKREEILKKVEVLCNKILDCNKNLTNGKKWGKHYVTILFVLANISNDRGKCCLKRKLIKEAIAFFDQALNLFREILTAKGITSRRENECFASSAALNNILFRILIKHFADNTEKMKRVAVHLYGSISFHKKLGHNKCKGLKKRLKNHCKDHDLKIESIKFEQI